MESGLVVAYLGRTPGGLLGTAYFDTHTVRTLPETIMDLVDAQQSRRIIDRHRMRP